MEVLIPSKRPRSGELPHTYVKRWEGNELKFYPPKAPRFLGTRPPGERFMSRLKKEWEAK